MVDHFTDEQYSQILDVKLNFAIIKRMEQKGTPSDFWFQPLKCWAYPRKSQKLQNLRILTTVSLAKLNGVSYLSV